mgnify:CR=1 FL=1
MKDILKVGIIQAIVDSDVTWNKSPKMDIYEANVIWRQIQAGFASFMELAESNRPDIIVLPELAVASCFVSRLRQFAWRTGAIVIAGVDFKLSESGKVTNQAVVYVPRDWPRASNVGKIPPMSFYFGKHFFSAEEKAGFSAMGKESQSCYQFYIVDLGEYGNLGVSICADFYDIERYAIYKGRIQHLIILANNKDVKSFYFLTEAISRLVYCNVVICNSGHYGGSVCFTLYKEDYKRYSYKHEGKDLFTTQVVSLPVEALKKAQLVENDKITDDNKKFKSQPPGYKYCYQESSDADEKGNEK